MKYLIRKLVHTMGNLLRFFHTTFLRFSGATIGKKTMISLSAKIDARRGKVIIGDYCLITHGSYILSHDGAAHVLDVNDNGEGVTTIGNHVFIGVNAVILSGVTIGDHAIIGAGAVVNRDIPEGAVAVGNPAKVIKQIDKPYPPLPKKHKL